MTSLRGPAKRRLAGRKKASPPAVVWLIVVALGAAALFGALANSAQRWDDPGAANGVRPPAQP